MLNANRYLAATSPRPGALAIVHAYGGEADLARCLDSRITARHMFREGKTLANNELRYGWLWSPDGGVVDEVMLAKAGPGMRVLMTHGGMAVREAVAAHFAAMEFLPLVAGEGHAVPAQDADSFDNPLLACCMTEAQAAAVLEALQARERGEAVSLPERLLLTHRIVVCGPPNAGKSSLLNALAGYERAFVDAEAGATRDVVDELVDVGGYAVLLGDLPGFAGCDGDLAAAAWEKASERLRFTEALWFVLDGSRGWEDGARTAAQEITRVLTEMNISFPEVVIVSNKSDLPLGYKGDPWREFFPHAHTVAVCCLPGGDAREKLGDMLVRAWAAPEGQTNGWR